MKKDTPFQNLPVHRNEAELTQEFIDKFVKPFYMEIGSSTDSGWPEKIKAIKPEITREICLTLLGDRNWRARKVGAYFAAVNNYREMIGIIGTHLLKSEVCCVGDTYAMVLAFFNGEECVRYLNEYLDYYLTKPELFYDQKDVMDALLYLDEENRTDHFSRQFLKWNLFMEERKKLEEQRQTELANYTRRHIGEQQAIALMDALQKRPKEIPFSTIYLREQMTTLHGLSR